MIPQFSSKSVEDRFKAAFCARRKRQLADFDKAYLEWAYAEIEAVEGESAAAAKKAEMVAAQDAKRAAVRAERDAEIAKIPK